jgi:hypothetical protein
MRQAGTKLFKNFLTLFSSMPAYICSIQARSKPIEIKVCLVSKFLFSLNTYFFLFVDH